MSISIFAVYSKRRLQSTNDNLVYSPSDFNPGTCDHTFTIATTDYAMQTTLPFALPRIYQKAPQVAFDSVHPVRTTLSPSWYRLSSEWIT
ncbi:hypothetical protein BZG10_10675 [Salinivibrio kushneri]|nr:hypothetical protein BZG10_10675 [Salinivibrio kushneri]